MRTYSTSPKIAAYTSDMTIAGVVLIPAPPFSEIWCGIRTTGSSSSPKLRRLMKT